MIRQVVRQVIRVVRQAGDQASGQEGGQTGSQAGFRQKNAGDGDGGELITLKQTNNTKNDTHKRKTTHAQNNTKLRAGGRWGEGKQVKKVSKH